MKLNKLGARVENWKKSINDERSLEYNLMHIVSEISECFEAMRDAEKRAIENDTSVLHELRKVWEEHGHPEGFGVELADGVMLIAYVAKRLGIDLDAMVDMKMDFHEEDIIKEAFR